MASKRELQRQLDEAQRSVKHWREKYGRLEEATLVARDEFSVISALSGIHASYPDYRGLADLRLTQLDQALSENERLSKLVDKVRVLTTPDGLVLIRPEKTAVDIAPGYETPS